MKIMKLLTATALSLSLLATVYAETHEAGAASGSGARGNTHFPMSDTNNLEIADLMSKFLKGKGLE
jgi:hypothetical protein